MIIKIFLFILCSAIALIFLKGIKSELTYIISAFIGVLIIVFALNNLRSTIDFILSLSEKIQLKSDYLIIILKCSAICFLGNFSTNLCKDIGEQTLAYGSELISRCLIISLTLPIYIDLFNWIIKLWENV